MDDECKSAIFDGDDELCYLLTDSKQLNKSAEYTSVIYFEKADCENTNNSSEVGLLYIVTQNKLISINFQNWINRGNGDAIQDLFKLSFYYIWQYC